MCASHGETIICTGRPKKEATDASWALLMPDFRAPAGRITKFCCELLCVPTRQRLKIRHGTVRQKITNFFNLSGSWLPKKKVKRQRPRLMRSEAPLWVPMRQRIKIRRGIMRQKNNNFFYLSASWLLKKKAKKQRLKPAPPHEEWGSLLIPQKGKELHF